MGKLLKRFGEVASMSLVVACLVGWSIWFGVESGYWLWCWCMSTIFVVVIFFEILAKIITDKTISQQFWAWSNKKNENGKKVNAWKAWIMAGIMIVGWLLLILHLQWKVLFR